METWDWELIEGIVAVSTDMEYRVKLKKQLRKLIEVYLERVRKVPEKEIDGCSSPHR